MNEEMKKRVTATGMLLHPERPQRKHPQNASAIDVGDMIQLMLYDNLQNRFPESLPKCDDTTEVYCLLEDWCKTHDLEAVASAANDQSDSVVYSVNNKDILRICTKVEFNNSNPSFSINFNVEALDGKPVIWREQYN